MKMTLEEIINDASIYGYDFNNLLSKIVEKEINDSMGYDYDFNSMIKKINDAKINIREYIYGYSLAKNKVSYLESMAKYEVEPCDRIYLF